MTTHPRAEGGLVGLAAFVSGRDELPAPIRLRVARDVLDALATGASVSERSPESQLRFERIRIHAEGFASVGGSGDESGAARLLWEILASRAAPEGGRPPRLHGVVDEVPPDVDEVVERALSGRYAGVDELREAFDEASRGLVGSREDVRRAFGFVDLDPTPPLARADVPLGVRAQDLAETLDRLAEGLWLLEGQSPEPPEPPGEPAEGPRPSDAPRSPVVRIVARRGASGLASALLAEGYRVDVDDRSGDDLPPAPGEAPACVVVEAGGGGEETFDLVRRMRASGAVPARTPLLVVEAPAEGEALAAFLVGADVCLRSPAPLEALVLQVGALVRMVRRLAPFDAGERRGRRAVEGDLSQISLATVLSVLEMERQSGIFEVWRGLELARLEVEGGRASGASYGGVRVSPLDALLRALAWPAGRFSFTPAAPNREPVAEGALRGVTIASGPTLGELLMEASRLRDEARSLDVEAGGVEG